MPTDEFGNDYCFTSRGGTPYSERQGSNEEDFSLDRLSAVKILRCPWKLRIPFAIELLGNYVQMGNTIIRTPPSRYPDARGLYCSNVKIKGRGRIFRNTETNEPLYKKGAILTATFTNPDPNNQEQQNEEGTKNEIELYTETLDFAAEFLTLKGSNFYTDVTGGWKDLLGDDHPVTQRLVHIEIAHTRHYVPKLPRQTVADKAGKINSAPWPPSDPRPAETLMFLGGQAKRITTLDGTRAWQIDYKYVEKVAKCKTTLVSGSDIRAAGTAAGWNREFIDSYRTATAVVPLNDWIKVLTQAGDRTIYETTSFDALYDPASP